MSRSRLGVCYYPEHWPESSWSGHATAMRELGIELVRVGEFAWSRIEPRPAHFNWDWLDRALDTLAAAGLDVVLGTPTACPPRWLVERYPEILPQTPVGVMRGFGSRRHYSFSSEVYREHCQRIVAELLDRYADRREIVGWQIDNEFGCHDTTQSFGPDAARRFRTWLEKRYGDIETLNRAWGTVFWSQEYDAFRSVPLPVNTVTEANPAHSLALRRFASDEVRGFLRDQTSLIRRRVGRSAWLTHNFMGNFSDFDHFELGEDLDLASWDSYPLGFLDQSWFDEATKRRYRQTGHPDWAAFHHDLYRGVGRGRFAVMEQQPGPVNWAACNASPLPGMVRLWAWEAIAHGAEFVAFFRWQQAPFAQEQMHAGLNLPTGEPAAVQDEVRRLATELAAIAPGEAVSADVALVFDYPSCWMAGIQPQSEGYSAFRQTFDYYSAARQLGLDVDIVSIGQDLNDYRLILLPGLLSLDDADARRLAASGATLLIGPRSGSKTKEFSISEGLPPGPLRELIELRVTSVDSIRNGVEIPFEYAGENHAVGCWLERIESAIRPRATTADGHGVYYRNERCHYVGGVTSDGFLRKLLSDICDDIGLTTVELDGGLRLARRGDLRFAVNYGPRTAALPDHAGPLLAGSAELARTDVAIWRSDRG